MTTPASTTAAAAKPAASTALDPATVATTVTQMLEAFADAVTGHYKVSAFEQHEFTQIIEDVHRYNSLFEQNELTQDQAQELINNCVADVKDTIATAKGLSEDTTAIAVASAMKIFYSAVQTTLSAAFSSFKFAL